MNKQFEETEQGIFRYIYGPASNRFKNPPCQWKICITATDEDYLSNLLYTVSKREDCYYVKYTPLSSPRARDGMMLGRVFLSSKEAVGGLWRELYTDEKLMCSIQDDAATEAFREHT